MFVMLSYLLLNIWVMFSNEGCSATDDRIQAVLMFHCQPQSVNILEWQAIVPSVRSAQAAELIALTHACHLSLESICWYLHR